MARLPPWCRTLLLLLPGLLLLVSFVLLAIGWYVERQMLDSGGALPPAMAAYDVRHYDLEVAVDPAERRISGRVLVTVLAEAELTAFEIHLDDRMKIVRVMVDDEPAEFEHHAGIVSVELERAWRASSSHRVSIDYGGPPKVALRPPWIDGFVWDETTSGAPWVGVTSEGDGGDIWWPCKDHPSDEPDEGMDIALTVPEGLVGLSNGRHLGETRNADGTVTSRWRIGFPINTYCVTANIGPYEPVEAVYRGVDGSHHQQLLFWALPEHLSEAGRMWRQMPELLAFLGRRFGEYPFLADKLWGVEAPYLGMEHQTLIAYGGGFENNWYGFDELLLHELAHEWWGNKVTASDWADVWLHEGFASYAEALFVLDHEGEARYLEYMQRFRARMANRAPVVRGRNLTATEAFSPDVYSKGAWVLHMLRWLLGDDLMDEVLWRFADGDHPDLCRTATTDDFMELVREIAGRDLDWFWQRYLFRADLPAWSLRRTSGDATDHLRISWDDPSFEMPLRVRLGDRTEVVAMPGGNAELEVEPGVEVVIDPYREVLAAIR